MTTQKQNKERAEKIKQTLIKYLNVPVNISFRDHSFETVIEDITLARLLDLTNPPDKREDKTPASVLFKCSDNNKLIFVMDDIESVRLTLDRAEIQLPNLRVDIYRCKS